MIKLIFRRILGIIVLPILVAWALIVLMINAVSLIVALPVLIGIFSAETTRLIISAFCEIYSTGAKEFIKRLLVVD